MTNRLPIPGSDDGSWGTILNDFLQVSHNSDGSLSTTALQNAGAITSINNTAPTNGNISITASVIGAGTYTKPANGIPITDLDSSIQSKINTTAPVSSVNSKTGSVSLTASDIGALSTSNNLSDITSASTARSNLGLGSSATYSSAYFVETSTVGVTSGVAGLDGNGRVPVAQLPLAQQFTLPSGAIAEAYPRDGGFTNSATQPASGQLYLASIVLAAGVTVHSISFGSSGTAATSPTNWWFGLFDSSANLLALTSNQLTTAWAANTIMKLNIATVSTGSATSFTPTYTGLYYIGFMMTASTVISLPSAGSNSATVIFGNSPVLSAACNTAMTTPPSFPFTASLPPASGAFYPAKLYGYIS